MGVNSPTVAATAASGNGRSLSDRLNGPWHERSLQVFMVIVLAHWSEHIVQAYQIYVLGWPVHMAGGVLGYWFPWLVHSEVLHYGYALVMLIGLWIFRRGFVGRGYTWWMIAFWIQFWHHIEHALLQGQVIVGHNLFGSPVPTSIVQLWLPAAIATAWSTKGREGFRFPRPCNAAGAARRADHRAGTASRACLGYGSWSLHLD